MAPLPLSRRAALAALAAAGLGAACRATPDAAAPRGTLDDLAERYVRLTLELAQHQPSLVEQWLGPESWRPGPRRPVARVRGEIEELQSAVTAWGAEPGERIDYLRSQITALGLAARRLSGESMSFFDETGVSLGVDAANLLEPLGDASEAVESARTELEPRLPGRGALAERYASFRKRHAIPADRLRDVLPAAIDACRVRVTAQLTLPDSERLELEPHSEAYLEGRARYEGDFRSRVSIAASGPVDLARLVWLVAHESYPGHHVQHVLADRDLVRSRKWRERQLYPAFGRHLLCAEGAAEAGAALLLDGSAFEHLCGDLARKADVQTADIDALVHVHRAVATLDIAIAAIARAYLDGATTGEDAAAALTERTLVPDAQQLLHVVERQRTRVLAYPVGRRLVAAQLAAAPESTRWQRLASIATSLTLPAPALQDRGAR